MVVYMGPLVLHTPASAHGAEVDNLMNITWILIFIVQAKQVYYIILSTEEKIERRYISLIISWRAGVIPAIILAGLILYGLYASNIMFIDEEDDAIVVELYGQQFYWAARVSGEDNVLGKANVRYIEGVNILG
jgi:cytochrome c oxidase subunit 2